MHHIWGFTIMEKISPPYVITAYLGQAIFAEPTVWQLAPKCTTRLLRENVACKEWGSEAYDRHHKGWLIGVIIRPKKRIPPQRDIVLGCFRCVNCQYRTRRYCGSFKDRTLLGGWSCACWSGWSGHLTHHCWM